MIQHLITYILHHLEVGLMHGGYWILGGASILEAVPFIGTIIPGHSLVMAGGFFAKLGVLNLTYVMLVSAIGAIIGDWLGYEIGKKYGTALIPKIAPYVLMKDEHVAKATNLLNEHTGKAVVMGRFTPATRALIPFLAGAIGIHKAKFWFFNCTGGILWAVSSVMVGYIFGASYEIAAVYFGRIAMIGVILAIVLFFAYRFVNKNRVIFKKYQLTSLFIAAGSLIIFFRLAEDALKPYSFFARIDAWVSIIVTNYQSPFWHKTAKIISDIISPTTLSVGVLVLFIVFLIKKKYHHDAWVTLLSFPAGTIGCALLKDVIMRERPISMTVKAGSWSFPSGHATASALFFSLLIYFAFKYIHNKILRELTIILLIILMIAGALDRVYLNVHWLTDIIAGLSLGVFCVSMAVLVVRYLEAMIHKRKNKQ